MLDNLLGPHGTTVQDVGDVAFPAAGYECQEADGDFMLVFETPVNALNFCLAVRSRPGIA